MACECEPVEGSAMSGSQCSRLSSTETAVQSSMPSVRIVGFDTSSASSTPCSSAPGSPRHRMLPESPLSRILRAERPLPSLRIHTGKPARLQVGRRALSMSAINFGHTEAASPFKPPARATSDCSNLSRSSEPIPIPWSMARTYTPTAQWMPDDDTPPDRVLHTRDGVAGEGQPPGAMTAEQQKGDPPISPASLQARPSSAASTTSSTSVSSVSAADSSCSVTLLNDDYMPGMLEDLFTMDLPPCDPSASQRIPSAAAQSAAVPPAVVLVSTC